MFRSDEAFIIPVQAVIKARHVTNDGRRFIDVEASNENVDSEGDVILQKGLLDAAPAFIRSGHIDVDHLSELGAQLGIPNPGAFIVGRPVEVKDCGHGVTSVVCEMYRTPEAEKIWESLQKNPPEEWRASVYGFPLPSMVEDCTSGECNMGARRYLIKGIDWRSLALTRRPVNDTLSNPAKIVTRKAFVDAIIKGVNPYAPAGSLSMSALENMNTCTKCNVHLTPNTVGYREHFVKCQGFPPEMSDIYAHALMHRLNIKALTGS